MAENIKSKVEKLQLLNGDTVELTLNFARLLYLRANGYEKEVKAAMNAINGTTLDMLDMPFLFYGAYLCATEEPKYTQAQFIDLMPWDMEEISTIYANINSKKKVDLSKMRSSAVNKKAK